MLTQRVPAANVSNPPSLPVVAPFNERPLIGCVALSWREASNEKLVIGCVALSWP